MKRLLFLLALGAIISLTAKQGCIDTSLHLKGHVDTKAEHYVNCNCPCDEYPQSERRNRCMKCEHLHHEKGMEIVNVNQPGNAEAARWMNLYAPNMLFGKKLK